VLARLNVATDAPLLPDQLNDWPSARYWEARTGAVSANSSDDLFIAFSTAVPVFSDGREHWSILKNDDSDPLLAATIEGP
jgi:L-aminopeptidase/D-esterase-like protein